MLTYLAGTSAFALGVLAVVVGEADDSPGLQFLGAVLAVSAVVLSVRAARARR